MVSIGLCIIGLALYVYNDILRYENSDKRRADSCPEEKKGRIGNIFVGGDAPVAVQRMTKCLTEI